jgi:hypothetical protein
VTARRSSTEWPRAKARANLPRARNLDDCTEPPGMEIQNRIGLRNESVVSSRGPRGRPKEAARAKHSPNLRHQLAKLKGARQEKP